jgi:uncharacterized repeat protein (TIGR01451 family)/CSLREA domain-containing protein
MDSKRIAPFSRWALALTLAFSVIMALPPQTARADTLTVNVTTDENDHSCSDGDCSLRDAIEVAVSGDTIDFSLSYPATITLGSGHLVIDKNLAITGPGAGQLTVSGNDAARVLWVDGSNVTLSDLTISHGYTKGGNGGNGSPRAGGGGAGLGGGLFVNTGVVTLTNVVFRDNRAVGGNGGGINSSGGAGGGGGGMWGNGGQGSTDSTAGAGGGGGGGGLTGNGGNGAGGFSTTNGGAAGAGGGGRGGDNDGFNPDNGDPGSDYGGGGGAGNGASGNGRNGGAGGFGGGGGGGNNSTGSTGGAGGFGGGGGGGINVGSAGAFAGAGCAGGPGGGGAGLGGAVFVRQGTLNLVYTSFFDNTANRGSAQSGCSNHGQGKGGALFANTGVTINDDLNTIASGNSADDAGTSDTDNAHFYTVSATGGIAFPEMDVQGNGQSIADGDSSPSSSDGTDFGLLAVGEQLTHTFVISNSGPANLHLVGSPRVGLSGPTSGDFGVTVEPDSPIASGDTTTFTIRFAPSASGGAEATVTITNTDATESPYTFAVKGATRGSTITVTTATDETNTNGQCSLREAILNANHNDLSGSADCDAGSGPYDILVFSPSLANMTTTLGSELVITESVIIDASGVDGVTISGGGSVRVFHVSDGGATFRALTIANGFVEDTDGSIYGGGGIYAEGSTTSVHLDRATVRGCQANGTYDDYSGYGGGLLLNYAAGYVVNSTFSGNGAEVSGGAIADYQGSSIEIAHSTLTNNHGDHAGTGAGVIYLWDGDASLENSILAGNTGGQDANYFSESGGTLTSLDYNLSDTNPGSALTQPGDQPNKDLGAEIKLGALQDNGGETWTHALLSGSVAIDAGKDTTCPAMDQRGVTRPQGSHCDVGAYEAEVSESSVSLSKSVAPDTNVAYHGTVTYTLVFSNSGTVNDTNVSLTDTLPAEMDFGRWIESHGATVTDDEITWSGVVTASESITFAFTATHTGGYGEIVTNTAEFSGTAQAGSAQAVFDVVSAAGLAIGKSVTPTGTVGYHGIVTYTIVLANAGAVNDTNVILTDTLPVEVDFGRWLENHGATVADDEITWGGGVTASTNITFTFTATHTGSYGDVVTNTAQFSGTVQQGSDGAAFGVEPNVAPVLALIGDKNVDELATLVFTATATDANGDPLTYALDAGSVGSIASGGTFTWTPGEAEGPGAYTATVRVSDGELEDHETITITVAEINQPPVLDPIGNKVVMSGTLLSFVATASDVDVPPNILTFTLDVDAPAGASIDPASGAFAWTPVMTGEYSITIRVTDNGSPVLDDSETITVTVTLTAPPNLAPVLDPIGDKSADELVTLVFTATATDPNSDPLTFTLDAGSVGSIAPGGAYSWTPTETQGPGTYTATVRVGDGELDDDETITITVNEANTAPVLGAIGSKSVNELATLAFTAVATDSDIPAQMLAFTLDAGSVGTITSDGAFDWTPTEAQGPGMYTATVRVSDGLLADAETITITVGEVNTAPALAPIGNKVVMSGTLLSFVAMASDADVPSNVLTFTLDAGAPAGASIDPAMGEFSWTPVMTGQYPITVRVTDNGSPMLDDAETITVTVTLTTPPNIAPVLIPIGDNNVDELATLVFTATATDANSDPLTFTLNAGSVGSITPGGAYSWTPTEAQGPGTYTATVRVGDGELEDHETITITVAEVNQPPVLDPIGNKVVMSGTLLSFVATASDADVPSNVLTFTLDAGAPAGASIDPASGEFSWTPVITGQYPITVRVTDNGSPMLDDSETITITVDEIHAVIFLPLALKNH